MGSGSSTTSSARGDGFTKSKGSSSIASGFSRRSPGLSADNPSQSSTRFSSTANFSATRCVDQNFTSSSDKPIVAQRPSRSLLTGQPSDATQTIPAGPNSRYCFSKHSMVFEDEGGVPDNVDARVHRAFKLDMRAAFKGKDASVVEVYHRLDNGTLVLLYRVKHRTKVPPTVIGSLADNADMNATWQLLDLYRQESFSRCNSDASTRRASSSKFKRHFSASVFGPCLECSSPIPAEEEKKQPAASPSTRLAPASASAEEADTPTFYARYIKTLDGEQRRLSLATDTKKTPRPAPVDPDYYVQQLYTATRVRAETPVFLDDDHQPRRLYRTCRWHVLPLVTGPSLTGSFRLTSPVVEDDKSGTRFTSPLGAARVAGSGEDGRRSSFSTLNVVSEGSQISSIKDNGVKPAPPILVTDSSFRLDSSTSSLPQWGETNRYVKLRLPRKSSVSFILKDAQNTPSEPDGHRPQGGINSVAHNLWTANNNLDDTMSLLSEYMFP